MKLLLFLSSMWVITVYLWTGIQHNISSAKCSKKQKVTTTVFDEEANPLNPLLIFKY